MKPESNFRPFAFITLSGVGHGLCVAALGLIPVAGIIGTAIANQPVEITEVAPVVHAAPSQEEVAKTLPVVAKKVAAAPIKVAAKPVAAKELPKAAHKSEAVEPVKEESKEDTVKDTVALAPDVSDADLKPVKEEAPVGVAAATDEEAAPAAEEKVEEKAVEKTEAPAPVPAAEAAPAAATGAANDSKASDEVAPATPAPAATADTRSYLDLKQKPGNRAPDYPLDARRTGRQGNVEMLYYVTREGKVTQAKVIKSSGSKDLDAEALRTIAQYRFVPGQEGWTKHPVLFSLKGQSEQLPGRLRTMGATSGNPSVH
jgi:periplasmic protein TonB